MWLALLAVCVIVKSQSYDQGWVPLTLEEVLLRSAHRYEPKPALTSSVDWRPRIDGNGEAAEIQLTKPLAVHQPSTEQNEIYDFGKDVERSHVTRTCKKKGIDKNPKLNIDENPASSNNLDIYSDDKTRRAKQLDDSITKREQELNTSTIQINIATGNIKEHHKYEVTEPPHVSDQTRAELTVINSTPGYIYNSPNNQNKQNNLTRKFLNILTKYNIRLKPDDTNYALSRTNPSNFSRDKLYLVTLPIKVPQGLNSQNHVALDPILAVLLSNYGTYLPGMFGSASKYRNLYGYLASNNIHNNGPFGLYKIFSDTDSSN